MEQKCPADIFQELLDYLWNGLGMEEKGWKRLKKGDFKKKMKNGPTYFSDFVLCLEKYKRQQGSQSALSTSFKVDVSPKVQYTSKRGGHIEETVGWKRRLRC